MEISKIKNIKSKISTKETFVDLVSQNKISLYRIAMSILKNEANVEDAISETIYKSYNNFYKLKDVNSFKPWIMKILVNECYSIIKKNKNIKLIDDFSIYNNSYEDSHDTGLMEYVNRLEEPFKAVVILFYYDDLSIKSISNILNISEGTVKSRLSRSKAKLKNMIDNM
ncbi:RNA polymerase sigma factor [Haloimpatiens sp. FM7315]|uniref:RNA polymerase sigma factor n=1 Tax=Haloimpatiens sp. FM7315 TaxID=3298609 RepID=UPI0035A3317D